MGEKRRIYFIDKGFQLRFVLWFCGIVIIASILMASLIYFLSTQHTTVAIDNTKVVVKATSDFIAPLLVWTVIITACFSALAVIILVVIMSHKIAGPLYRLQKELDIMKQGNLDVNFKIRKDDQLQNISASLDELASVLHVKHTVLSDKWRQLKATLDASLNSNVELQDITKHIDEVIEYFKTKKSSE